MVMVRSAVRQAILVLGGLLLLVVPPATSAAAEPSRNELAAATHAASVAVTADGTAWFVPERGSEWRGRGHSILGSVAADGTVSERRVPGFASLDDVATSPEGDLWVSGLRGHGKDEVFKISHLSPTGQVLRRYRVGRARGSRTAMTVTGDAVWFIRERDRSGDPLTTIESVDTTSGYVRSVKLPLGCRAYALAMASDGTPWFTQKCGGFLGDGSKSKTSISHLGPAGEVIRQPIAAKDYPVSLAIGPEGTVWFGAWAYYEESHIGRLTSSGDLAEFPIPKGSPVSIAMGPEARLWFPTSRGGYARSLVSMGIDGDLSEPICADPTCDLEPSGLTKAPDGSLWYRLIRPNYNTGGGGSGIYIDQQIHNEAGFLGRLVF
jgi:virginiamycin B lyase